MALAIYIYLQIKDQCDKIVSWRVVSWRTVS